MAEGVCSSRDAIHRASTCGHRGHTGLFFAVGFNQRTADNTDNRGLSPHKFPGLKALCL